MISVNPKIEFASLEIMFWRRALHQNKHIYTCIHIWNAIFQNIIYELDIGIVSSFLLEWRLTRFGKALFVCILFIYNNSLALGSLLWTEQELCLWDVLCFGQQLKHVYCEVYYAYIYIYIYVYAYIISNAYTICSVNWKGKWIFKWILSTFIMSWMWCCWEILHPEQDSTPIPILIIAS